MKSVFWALVRKDLYLMRGFIAATAITGVVSGLLMSLGKIGFAVGGVLFLSADIASGLFIAMYTLITERKEQSRLFALSLPISGRRYEQTKLAGGYLTYGIAWLILTVLAVGMFLLPAAAANRGMIVYVIVLQVFALAVFGVVLAALFIATTEMASGLVILVVNIGFSLFVVQLNQPQISNPLHGPTLIWTQFASTAVFGSVLVLALAGTGSLFFTSRRRDHI